MMSGQCPVGVGVVFRASCLVIVGCVYFTGEIGRTGQNRTFPDIVGLGGVGGGWVLWGLIRAGHFLVFPFHHEGTKQHEESVATPRRLNCGIRWGKTKEIARVDAKSGGEDFRRMSGRGRSCFARKLFGYRWMRLFYRGDR